MLKRNLIILFGFLTLLTLGACSSAPVALSSNPTASLNPSSLPNNTRPAPQQTDSPHPASGLPGTTENILSPAPQGTLNYEQKASATAAAMQSFLQILQEKGYIDSASGAYHQLDGRTTSVIEPYDRDATIIEGFYPSNFVLRAEIAWSKPDIRYWDKDTAGCGFAFHLNTDGNYEFKIRMDGAASLARLENETQYSFKAYKIEQTPYRSQFMPEGNEIVTLIVKGNQVTALVDDREILKTQDDQLTSKTYGAGLLAFIIENSEAHDSFKCTWSKVELWEIDKPSEGEAPAPVGTVIPTLIQDAESYYNVGVSQYQKGDYPSAIVSFTKAIDMEPDVYVSYYARAILYYVRGDYPNALKDLDKTIELSPELAVAYYRRGRVYEYLGDTEKATVDYNKAKELGYVK